MSHFSFTVHVSGIDLDDRYEDALYEAGCDDALVSVVDGNLQLDFDREAPSFDAAVGSAVQSILHAGGRIIGVDHAEFAAE